MALITTKEMFKKALVNDYAVGAFNVNNMEIIQGIVECGKHRERTFNSSGFCWRT